MMKEQLEAIRKGALEAIAGTKAAAELDALRVKYLGKKGELTAVLKLMGSLSAEERPVMARWPTRSAPPWKRPWRPSPPFWKRPLWKPS